MEVLLDPLNEISIQLQGRHIRSSPSKLFFGKRPHLLADRDALVGRKNIRHLACVEGNRRHDAVASTSSFEAAVGRAVNFLGDADTVGAVAGQIAGAFYGETEIDPRHLAALRKFERGEICGRACLCFLLGRQQAIRDGRRDGRLLPRVTGGSVAAWLVGLPQHRRLLLSRLLGAALVGLFAVAAAVLFERKKWQY